MNKSLNAGFTLIELMIVVVIVGILAMVAVPSYNNSVTKARCSDGQAALLDIMAKQERFFTENNLYTTNMGAGGLNLSNTSSQEGYYTIAAANDCGGLANCVTLTATPPSATAQSTEGWISLNSLGIKNSENANAVCRW